MSLELTHDMVEAARDGDERALSAVYLALAPGVHAYLSAKGVHDPEAVTQDVFLGVFSRIAGVSGGAPGLRTFVFSVAHARMVDDVRRRARRPEPLPYDVDSDARASPSAEHEALGRADAQFARALLAELQPEHAEVISLRILGDLSIEQTAQIMGRTPGAIKQLQRRALAQLNALLADRCVTG